MQVSIVGYNELNKEFRIDAEYYKFEILEKIKLLEKKNYNILDNLVSFVVGPFGSTIKVEQYVEKSNYKYIRNKNINGLIISDDETAFISKNVFLNYPQFHIEENDLLITVVGTLGKVAIAQKKDANSIFSCKSTLIRPKYIDPYYLLTYLNSTIGQLFVLRGVRGAIQQGLNLSDLKEIKVFIPSGRYQNIIRDIIQLSFKYTNDSKRLYYQAEQILLSELGLLNWKPKHKHTFIKNYYETQKAERIDAEYFQPKYEEIVRLIKDCKGGYKTLNELVSIMKCIEPGSEAYQDEGVPFIRVSNLSIFKINENNLKYVSDKLYKKLIQFQPDENEILLSKDATPGIAYHIREKKKMIPSGGILRLKVRNKELINEDYLTLVLNSIIVQEQIKRDIGGSVILHWRPDQVKETIIPILRKELQNEIKEKINESFISRKKSKQLLEIAKKGVEITIEENEEIAEGWIDNELKNINTKEK